ncbi:Uncharacterised protein [Pseudomonas putida]|nr:Uncharacterised protein [Pseudomonas putida]
MRPVQAIQDSCSPKFPRHTHSLQVAFAYNGASLNPAMSAVSKVSPRTKGTPRNGVLPHTPRCHGPARLAGASATPRRHARFQHARSFRRRYQALRPVLPELLRPVPRLFEKPDHRTKPRPAGEPGQRSGPAGRHQVDVQRRNHQRLRRSPGAAHRPAPSGRRQAQRQRRERHAGSAQGAQPDHRTGRPHSRRPVAWLQRKADH